MAKTKAELLDEAKTLGLDVNAKMKVAQLQDAISTAPKQEETKHEAVVAKSGKRSEKAIKEAEEKQVKLEKQHSATDEESTSKPKTPAKPARSRLERQGKKFQESAKLIDKTKLYSLKEAIDLAIKTSPVKFDASVEFHVRLGVDPKQADQNIRDTLVLPAGTGKNVRVAVFTEADKVAAAKKAGADIAGADEFLQELEKGKIEFDVLIAQPNLMAKLGKYARVLGPKGLMPNPKSGTVTMDIEKAVKEAKAGRVEYRVDSQGIVHCAIGKVSFGQEKLQQNAQALLSSLKGNKPSSIKSTYVKSIYASTSMGPSIAVETTAV